MAKATIKEQMGISLEMSGSVNGHAFKIIGTGTGHPYKGTHTINLKVIEGGPLPFAYDILTTAFQYGNRAFTDYPSAPEVIEDYFKQSFPKGYTWERTMTFEDNGICTVTSDISLNPAENSFTYIIRFDGVNFPPDGPVMQKKTLRWEPSTEAMFVRDKALIGVVNRTLVLQGGGHYVCNFRTTYKAKDPATIQMPKYHFVDHRIEILEHTREYDSVTVYENAVAHYSPLPIKSGK